MTMQSVLCGVLIGLLQTTPKVDPPPAPDFKTPVDYAAALEIMAIAGQPASQNAAELYNPLLGAADNLTGPHLLFKGFHTSGEKDAKVAPWDPKEHADWERAYQDTKSTVEKFRAAAARPYAWWGWRYDSGADKFLYSARLGELSNLRTLAKGAAENAWRAPGGKIDGSAFVADYRAVLGLARQLDRNPTTIGFLVGTATRALAYGDLLRALDGDTLGEKTRAELLTMLKARDDAAPSFRFALCAENAMAYDFLQAVHLNGGKYGLDQKQGIISLKGDSRADCEKARDALKTLFATMLTEIEKPFDGEAITRMDAAAEEAASAEPVVKAMGASFSRAYELNIRCEAMRRGTRLAYEIVVYHDKNKKWPASLKDLPGESDRKLRIDPFSNQPFVYKLEDDKPLLYSVGVDGHDDGGSKHDRKFGEDEKAADYIFLPVQK